ncbi:MAG: hypothetical protein ACTSWP_03700 [Candidatus Freyarchaeota archaeon]
MTDLAAELEELVKEVEETDFTGNEPLEKRLFERADELVKD